MHVDHETIEDVSRKVKLLSKWKTWRRVTIGGYRLFNRQHGFIRAAALTYTSFLAIIPLGIMVSMMVRQFGFLDLLMNWVSQWNQRFDLELPMRKINELYEHVAEFDMSNLGVLGAFSLLFTFYLTMAAIEENLNGMWGIRKRRPIWASILLFLPFLLIVASLIGLVALFLREVHQAGQQVLAGHLGVEYGELLNVGGLLIFFGALIWVFFFLMYIVLLRVRVHRWAVVWAATFSTGGLAGLVFGGVRIQSLIFERYSVVYGSLAIIPLFLLFAFSAWTIVLAGSALCFRLHRALMRSDQKKQPQKT